MPELPIKIDKNSNSESRYTCIGIVASKQENRLPQAKRLTLKPRNA